jgi:AraC-like DNA-binding protein
MRNRLRTQCIDETNQCPPPGWEQRVLRVGRGPYAYGFDRLALDDGLDIEHATFSGAVRLDAALAAEAVHVLFPYGTDLRVQGIPFEANLTVVTPTGKDFGATSFKQSGGVNVQVGGQLLRRLLSDQAIELPARRDTFLAGGMAAARELRQALYDALACDIGADARDESARALLRQEIIDGVAALLGEMQQFVPDIPSRGSRRREIAGAAACLLRERTARCDTQQTSQGALCAELGVASRTLQLAFQETFGVGFRAYERAVRLEQAHRLLRNAHTDLTVTEVALRCGFLHLGRFAAFYRQVYGVKPSVAIR